MQAYSNHESLLNVFEMDDIDPIDIFEERKSAVTDITKPSRFSTPNRPHQEDEHTQLRRECASTLEEESLIPGIDTSINTSMKKTENEMLVSTPRIEVRIAETSSAFPILFLFRTV